jgi:hypothetical protein
MVKSWEILQNSTLVCNLSQLSWFGTFSVEICKFLHTLSDSRKSNKNQNKDVKKHTNLQDIYQNNLTHLKYITK